MANAINSLNFNDNIYTFTLPYGTCSTAADTAAKTVDVDNFSLEKGARVLVKFTVTNNASSPTLNVEGTGAKAIYYRGSAINAGVLAANRTYEFVYNGTQWDLIGDLDTNTTYGAATTSAAGLMSAEDKKRLDSVVGLTPLSTPNRTIAELRTALDNWLNTHKNFAHATAIFSGSADWINKWNNEDLTTAFSPGGKWTVTVIASYSENTYVHLRFAYYNDQDIVYVVKNNNVWKPARKVAFKNKLSDGTVGSSSKPIYLNNGVPTECGTLSLSTTGNAATATRLSIVSGSSS